MAPIRSSICSKHRYQQPTAGNPVVLKLGDDLVTSPSDVLLCHRNEHLTEHVQHLEAKVVQLRSLQASSDNSLAQEHKRYEELKASFEALQKLLADLRSSLVQEQSRSSELEQVVEQLKDRSNQVHSFSPIRFFHN